MFILSSTLILPVILFQQRCSSLPLLWHGPRFMPALVRVTKCVHQKCRWNFQFLRHVSWFTKHTGHSSLSIVFLTRQTPSHPDLGEGEKISLWNFNFLHECSHMNVPYFHRSRCYHINIRVWETSKSVGICSPVCTPPWGHYGEKQNMRIFSRV